MVDKTIIFRAKVGIGQIYIRNGLLYQDGSVIGKVTSIHQVESNMNGEVFVIGRYLPQAIESNEQPSEAVAEEEVYGNDCRNGQCS